MKIFIFVCCILAYFVSSASATPQQWSENGHYYDFIRKSATWQNSNTWQVALSEASGLTYMGQVGYLATITSANENAFFNTNFNSGLESQFAWIGGYEPGDNGIWKWASGPEANVQFSNYGSPTPPFNYVNWGGIEPNDRQENEDYAMFNIGSSFAGIAPGQWADAVYTPSGFDPVVGYFVEYGPNSVVPEPVSTILFSIGGATLAVFRRLKSRRNIGKKL